MTRTAQLKIDHELNFLVYRRDADLWPRRVDDAESRPKSFVLLRLNFAQSCEDIHVGISISSCGA
jgi:hypothetical protein